MGNYSQLSRTANEWAFGEVERALDKGIQLRVGLLTTIHFLALDKLTILLFCLHIYANTCSRVSCSPLFFVLSITCKLRFLQLIFNAVAKPKWISDWWIKSINHRLGLDDGWCLKLLRLIREYDLNKKSYTVIIINYRVWLVCFLFESLSLQRRDPWDMSNCRRVVGVLRVNAAETINGCCGKYSIVCGLPWCENSFI